MIRRYLILNLGQSQTPLKQILAPEVSADWLKKIHSYMDQVASVQAWVAANPEKAVSLGLDKDAAALPSSGDIQSYPQLAALVDDLTNSRAVDPSALQCIDSLGTAVQAATAKVPAPGIGDFVKSPLGIGVGAGVLALVGGLVAFR